MGTQDLDPRQRNGGLGNDLGAPVSPTPELTQTYEHPIEGLANWLTARGHSFEFSTATTGRITDFYQNQLLPRAPGARIGIAAGTNEAGLDDIWMHVVWDEPIDLESIKQSTAMNDVIGGLTHTISLPLLTETGGRVALNSDFFSPPRDDESLEWRLRRASWKDGAEYFGVLVPNEEQGDAHVPNTPSQRERLAPYIERTVKPRGIEEVMDRLQHPEEAYPESEDCWRSCGNILPLQNRDFNWVVGPYAFNFPGTPIYECGDCHEQYFPEPVLSELSTIVDSEMNRLDPEPPFRNPNRILPKGATANTPEVDVQSTPVSEQPQQLFPPKPTVQ